MRVVAPLEAYASGKVDIKVDCLACAVPVPATHHACAQGTAYALWDALVDDALQAAPSRNSTATSETHSLQCSDWTAALVASWWYDAVRGDDAVGANLLLDAVLLVLCAPLPDFQDPNSTLCAFAESLALGMRGGEGWRCHRVGLAAAARCGVALRRRAAPRLQRSSTGPGADTLASCAAQLLGIASSAGGAVPQLGRDATAPARLLAASASVMSHQSVARGAGPAEAACRVAQAAREHGREGGGRGWHLLAASLFHNAAAWSLCQLDPRTALEAGGAGAQSGAAEGAALGLALRASDTCCRCWLESGGLGGGGLWAGQGAHGPWTAVAQRAWVLCQAGKWREAAPVASAVTGERGGDASEDSGARLAAAAVAAVGPPPRDSRHFARALGALFRLASAQELGGGDLPASHEAHGGLADAPQPEGEREDGGGLPAAAAEALYAELCFRAGQWGPALAHVDRALAGVSQPAQEASRKRARAGAPASTPTPAPCYRDTVRAAWTCNRALLLWGMGRQEEARGALRAVLPTHSAAAAWTLCALEGSDEAAQGWAARTWPPHQRGEAQRVVWPRGFAAWGGRPGSVPPRALVVWDPVPPGAAQPSTCALPFPPVLARRCLTTPFPMQRCDPGLPRSSGSTQRCGVSRAHHAMQELTLALALTMALALPPALAPGLALRRLPALRPTWPSERSWSCSGW